MTFPRRYAELPSFLQGFSCPRCGTPLIRRDDAWQCDKDSLRFPLRKGIPDFVPQERKAEIAEFLTAYQALRRKEEWGIPASVYYRSLPYSDLSGYHSAVWKVRALSYAEFLRDLGQQRGTESLRVADLGAGNCWLSSRLSDLGHSVLAVDVSLDGQDGLGVAPLLSNGQLHFSVVRADFEALPLPPHSLDVIVFNASLHYARSPRATMQSLRRLLVPNGLVYVIDSPWYSSQQDGEKMIVGLCHRVKRKHGIILPRNSPGYLTMSMVAELEGYSLRTIPQPLGLRSAVSRCLRLAFGMRDPASFPLVVLEKTGSA